MTSKHDAEFFDRMRVYLQDECAWFGMDEPDTVESLQEAYEYAVAPPKPEEPQGLGAVVEDEDGEKWMRFTNNSGGWPWIHAGPMDSRKYADIAAVRVLSEGVVV